MKKQADFEAIKNKLCEIITFWQDYHDGRSAPMSTSEEEAVLDDQTKQMIDIVKKYISETEYIVLESHPNMLGLWVGAIGDKEKIQKYVKDMDTEYLYTILKLKPGSDIQEHIPEQFGLVWDEEVCRWKKKQ